MQGCASEGCLLRACIPPGWHGSVALHSTWLAWVSRQSCTICAHRASYLLCNGQLQLAQMPHTAGMWTHSVPGVQNSARPQSMSRSSRFWWSMVMLWGCAHVGRWQRCTRRALVGNQGRCLISTESAEQQAVLQRKLNKSRGCVLALS